MTAPPRDEASFRYVVANASGVSRLLVPLPPGYEVTEIIEAPLEVELVVQDVAGNRRRIWPPEDQE